jgi:hypothetical protein
MRQDSCMSGSIGCGLWRTEQTLLRLLHNPIFQSILQLILCLLQLMLCICGAVQMRRRWSQLLRLSAWACTAQTGSTSAVACRRGMTPPCTPSPARGRCVPSAASRLCAATRSGHPCCPTRLIPRMGSTTCTSYETATQRAAMGKPAGTAARKLHPLHPFRSALVPYVRACCASMHGSVHATARTSQLFV